LEASFSKSFRGYDVSEVDAYIQSVQDFETETQNSLAKLNQKSVELEAEVTRLREIESSLFRALKLAEESQQNFEAKMGKEAKSILDKANKEAEAIKKQAQTDAQKLTLLTENERKQTLAKANQDLKEQERQLRNLQEAQSEIASQLKQISEQTLGSISQWSATELVKPVPNIDSVGVPAAKRGRKPGVKNKPKATIKKPKATAKAKLVTPKAVKVAKPKAVSPSAAPKKRGPKSKIQANATVKTGAKRGPKPKITLETVSDDGLPTLNKVLEAYAKSTGPRGKVGEIN
jgi:cell division initiation protein